MNTLLFMEAVKPGEILLLLLIFVPPFLFYKWGYGNGYRRAVKDLKNRDLMMKMVGLGPMLHLVSSQCLSRAFPHHARIREPRRDPHMYRRRTFARQCASPTRFPRDKLLPVKIAKLATRIF